MEAAINTLLRDQFFVRSLLNHNAFLKNDDAIRILDRG